MGHGRQRLYRQSVLLLEEITGRVLLELLLGAICLSICSGNILRRVFVLFVLAFGFGEGALIQGGNDKMRFRVVVLSVFGDRLRISLRTIRVKFFI